MRPDRIVVGEVRGAEAFELSRAVNAGCGFLCTIHANNATEALHALVNAALMAGENVTERIVRKVFSQSLGLVVHLDRDDFPPNDTDGIRRQVMELVRWFPPSARTSPSSRSSFARPCDVRSRGQESFRRSREPSRWVVTPRSELADHRRGAEVPAMTLVAGLARRRGRPRGECGRSVAYPARKIPMAAA